MLDSILEQGFLLGLAWCQDRNQALQNDPYTTTNTTPTGPSEEDILDSELNESSLQGTTEGCVVCRCICIVCCCYLRSNFGYVEM